MIFTSLVTMWVHVDGAMKARRPKVWGVSPSISFTMLRPLLLL